MERHLSVVPDVAEDFSDPKLINNEVLDNLPEPILDQLFAILTKAGY
jgi:hypothetical protein